MNLLGAVDGLSSEYTYLDIAQFIVSHSQHPPKELFRRIAFSIAERKETTQRRYLAEVIHDLDPTKNIPPQEFVGGIFPRKYVSLLIAPPGTGKTIFVQKFVSDLSMGGSTKRRTKT